MLMNQEGTGPVSELQFAKWSMSAFTLSLRDRPGVKFFFGRFVFFPVTDTVPILPYG